MQGILRQVTAPSTEPCTIQQVKDQLRLDASETIDDNYIAGLISAARMYLEKICWRVLFSQTWELTLPGFLGDDRFQLPARRNFSNTMLGYEWTNTDRAYRFFPFLELPLGNLDLASPIVSFQYTDPDGNVQTLDPSIYEVDTGSVPGRMQLAYAQTWPLSLDHWNAVKVQFKVGWTGVAPVTNPPTPPTPTQLPTPLYQCILLHAAQMYENRTPEVIVRGASIPVGLSYDALVSPYRLVRY